MTKVRTILAGLLLVGLLAPGALLAAPTGEEVLDNYIKVTGGKDAYGKIKSRVVTGKVAVPAQGLNASLEVYQKAPSMHYTAIMVGEIGKIETGYNGTVGWEKHPMTGTRVLAGDELSQLVRQARLDGDVNWRDNFTKVENVGTEKVGGADAYKLEMTTNAGTKETRHYDVNSGLLLQSKTVAKTGQGDFPMTAVVSDWKEIDGIKFPMKTTQKIEAMGQAFDQIITLETIQQNVDIPDAKFALPPDVKAKIESAPATQPGR